MQDLTMRHNPQAKLLEYRRIHPLREFQVQINRYDGEGLRHEMEENGRLIKFLYNEDREVVAEETSNGTITRYIRGLGIEKNLD